MSTVAELFERLDGDAWRVSHPFSEDMLQANALLHNSAATEQEMAECLMLWCKQRQPCQFGKAAASQGSIHFCFLRDEAVGLWSDEEIAEKISEERLLWKQRAAYDPRRTAHSFVIVISSPRVAFAPPDRNLRAFSDRILELAGWEPSRQGVRRKNLITSDFLYLKNPNDSNFYGFRFNVDFFACAGDGRWWHDHRFPGGIAFTANSTGHMMRFREWYQGKDASESWGLKQAMLTIKNAAPTGAVDNNVSEEQGRGTWLRPLDHDGRPFDHNVRCPLNTVPAALEGKDWTRYEGLLHTDHAVREEFFFDRDRAPTSSSPYIMDFTYLYDENQPDFEDFSLGKFYSEEDVFAELGRPENRPHRATLSIPPRSAAETATVAEQLDACRSWESLSWHDPFDS